MKPQLARRCDLTVMEVSGEDSASFLQGQVCCDIRLLENSSPLFSACCDYKGRAIANFWIWGKDKSFYLLLPKSMFEITLNHFKKFAVFSKVVFKEDQSWLVFNYTSSNNNSLQFVEQHAALPMKTNPSLSLQWFIGHQQSMEKIWEILSNDAEIIDENILNYLMILAEFFFIQPQTSALFVPQMIGLDKSNGISFNKGCFLGQEVIARAQHLGQLKRHLHSFCLPVGEAALPSIADTLKSASGEVVGNVVSVATESKETYRILAVVQDRAQDTPIYL